MTIVSTPRPLSHTVESRCVMLSANLDPVSFMNAYQQNEITIAQIDHRSLAVTLHKFASGEDMQAFELTAYEVEQLLQQYRLARRAHAHVPTWTCEEEEHPF